MDDRGILRVISEMTLQKHRAYAEQLKCREMVLRKGVETDERDLLTLYRARRRSDTAGLFACASETFSHACYFASFCPHPTLTDAFFRRFGASTSLFYRLREEACAAREFLYIGTDARGGLLTGEQLSVFLRMRRLPVLALDVCEHAYFYDYGFDRDAYIRCAIAALDIGRLAKKTVKKEEKDGKTD